MAELVMQLLDRLKNGKGVGAIFARGAVRSFSAKALGLGIGFLLQIVMARALGIEQFGIYAFALSWVNVLLFLVVLGANKAILRFLPTYQLSESTAQIAGLLRWATSRTLIAGLAVCLAIWGYLTFFAAAGDQDLIKTMALAAVLLPFFGLSQLRQAGLNAMKQVFRAELADTFIRPILLISLVVYWVWFHKEPLVAYQAMLMQLGAVVVSFLIGTRWLMLALPDTTRRTDPIYDVKVWQSMALPMMIVAGIQILLKQTDVIMLGIITSTTESGIYSVMVRLSNFAMFGLAAVNAMAAPMIAELHASGQKAALQRVVILAVRGSVLFMLAASALLVIFVEPITTLYGQGFNIGLIAFYILLIGQAVNAATGPVGFIMSMTGHQMLLAKVQGASAVINILLNMVLIPRYGLEGAAIATAISMATWNVWLLIYVRKILKIRISPL
ncbi:MAG: flippase [Candidatus Thiodiazotropha sp. (ex Lucinoma borealis)]|nr:flippase [Candidatus Thiodiazotropha sp. (ex Lucinoma borealis)]